uniref:Uncharacterized protein n=1 Tax=Anguilla anguilla TaxID=7936 RepID=A0A0E9TWP0_ANGAN
MLSQAQKAQR